MKCSKKRGPKPCIVKNCPGKNAKDIRLFSIPSSNITAWCRNLKIDEESIKTTTQVCSRHFKDSDMGSKKLKGGARPTINLGHDEVEPSSLPKGKKKIRKCSVRGCDTTSPPSTVFSFPTDPKKAKLWIDNCDLKEKPGAHMYVCTNHFDKRMIGKGKLYTNAVPRAKRSTEESSELDPLASHDAIPSAKQSTEENFELDPLACPDPVPVPVPKAEQSTEESSHQLHQKLGLPHHIEIRAIDTCVNCRDFLKHAKHFEDQFLEEKRRAEVATSLYTQERNFLQEQTKKLQAELEISKSRFEERNFLMEQNKKLQAELEIWKSRFEERNFLVEQNKKLQAELEIWKSRFEELSKKKYTEEKYTENPALAFAQVIDPTRRQQYTKIQKELLLNLNYVSCRAYKFMRQELKLNIPCPKTLGRWSPLKRMWPGINSQIQANLRHFVRNMSALDRNCILVLDDIGCRKELEWNETLDQIDGFEDFGNGERTKNIATKAIFLVLKGIFNPYRIIVSFHFSELINGSKLSEFVLENLEIIFKTGFQVRGVVSDSSGYEALNLLKESREDNHFLYEGGHKIYVYEDYCHLFKKIRDCLYKNDIVTANGVASWNVIEEFFIIDSQNRNRLAPKLTTKHMKPKAFERSRLRLAVQVMSRTVSTAIRRCYNKGQFQNELNIKNAIATASFLQEINNAFDYCDSNSADDKNSNKRPITIFNGKMEKMRETIRFLKALVLPSKIKIPCTAALIRTMSAMIALSEDLLQMAECSSFAPCRLNLDWVENQSVGFRAILGHRKFPSVGELQVWSARLMSKKMIRHKYEYTATNNNNCPEEDQVNDDENALDAANVNENEYSKEYAVSNSKSWQGKLKCSECKSELKSLEHSPLMKSEDIISESSFSFDSPLFDTPDSEFFKACKTHVEVFNETFPQHCEERGISDLLVKKCIDATAEWFDEKNKCREHRISILGYLIKTLMHKYCCWLCPKEEPKSIDRPLVEPAKKRRKICQVDDE